MAKRSISRFAALCAFLLPVSAASYSLNYSYVLLGARYPLKSARRLPVEVQLFAVVCVASYTIALVFFSGFEEHFMASQFGSFLVLLLPVLVLFLRIPHSVDEVSAAVFVVSI